MGLRPEYLADPVERLEFSSWLKNPGKGIEFP